MTLCKVGERESTSSPDDVLVTRSPRTWKVIGSAESDVRSTRERKETVVLGVRLIRRVRVITETWLIPSGSSTLAE